VQATYDSVLNPEIFEIVGKLVPNLSKGEVAATHWALTQKPDEVNGIIRKWLEGQRFYTRTSL
jgi:hypothetical protein